VLEEKSSHFLLKISKVYDNAGKRDTKEGKAELFR